MNMRAAPHSASPLDDDTVGETELEFGPLAQMIGFMIRVVQVQIFRFYYEKFAEFGLTTGALSMLIALRSNPGTRQGALANAMLIKRSNMTKIVQKLERDGLLRRHVPDIDRRTINLELTANGRRLVDELIDQALAHDLKSTAALSRRERQMLLSLLTKLHQARPRPSA